MSLTVRSKNISYSGPAIEERGHLCPEELDFITSDLNIKVVRILEGHSLQTTRLPATLSSLKFIHVVDLSGTQIRGEDLEHLPPRIRELNVEDCEEIEALPATLKGLEFLTHVNASKTYIHNESLENLPASLEVLKIESCRRISVIPRSFLELRNLNTVYLTDTKISSLERLHHNVEKIHARQCPIFSIDSSFRSRTNLIELHLAYKYFMVDFLRFLVCEIVPGCAQLNIISIDRCSAAAFYNTSIAFYKHRHPFDLSKQDGFSTQRCVELIKKIAPHLKNVSINITE